MNCTAPGPEPSIHRWLPCSLLGSGSSARVSLALSLHDGLLFAVKSTPCPSPASPSQLLAIDSELHILQSLSSPTILRCLGADYTTSQHNGTPVSRNLFLEYMEGGSLADLLRNSGGRLEESRVRCYTRVITEGLSYLHQNGIVHCDIKGQNILIGSSGMKIADFGAAKRVTPGTSEAGSSPFQGTPLWMAPEVVQGVDQGFPSDVWSLGCTVVEMLQGRPPWGHITNAAAALYKLACSQESPPLPQSISEEARDFLLHCLQRDPKARWTAAELLQHPFVCGLEAAAEHEVGKCLDAQPSPRSTLDFFQSGGEWEDGSDWSTHDLSMASPPTAAAHMCSKRQFTDAFIPDAKECDWITVKRAAGWCKEKQVPFMKLLPGAAGELERHVRGCEVSFEALGFLKARKVVG